jgi:hypothetical protein
MFDQPERTHKLLTGWNQKVCGPVWGLQHFPTADVAPPAERHNPSPSDPVD